MAQTRFHGGAALRPKRPFHEHRSFQKRSQAKSNHQCEQLTTQDQRPKAVSPPQRLFSNQLGSIGGRIFRPSADPDRPENGYDRPRCFLSFAPEYRSVRTDQLVTEGQGLSPKRNIQFSGKAIALRAPPTLAGHCSSPRTNFAVDSVGTRFVTPGIPLLHRKRKGVRQRVVLFFF